MNRRVFVGLCLTTTLVLTLGLWSVGQEVIGTLTNFDVVNTSSCPVDDFEVCFEDMSDPPHSGPWCIESWYQGWGAPPDVTSTADGFCVRWHDINGAIQPGGVRHFGLRLAPDCLYYMNEVGVCARAFWTIGGYRVKEVPLPMQSWLEEDGVVIDMIAYCNDDVGMIEVERGYATLREALDLNMMMWKNIDMILSEYATSGEYIDDTFKMEPSGEPAYLRIPVGREDRAIMVWYLVRVDGIETTRVMNQAILGGCW